MLDKRKLIGVLYGIYDKKDNMSYEELATSLNAIKINSVVNYLVYHDNKEYDDVDREMMVVIVKLLQYIYNNSDVTPPISDELYDELYACMLSDGTNDIVGADVGSDRTIVHHKYPDLRGTLNKVHFFTVAERGKDNRLSIENWKITSENTIGRPLRTNEAEITMFPKYDGVSVIFECDENGNVERALTRGNTEKNEACLIPLLQGIKFTPYEPWRGDPFGVKTEIVMTYDNYEKYCKKYGAKKSPRSAASSIINNTDMRIDFLRYISIIPLRMQNLRTMEIIIHPDAYDKFPHIDLSLNKINEMPDKFDELRDYMTELMGVPCDGVVLYMSDENIRDMLGRDGAINKFEVAYKFPPLGTKTILLDVEFSVGLLGSISPVAKVKPVVMHGNTIKSVSLGSIDRFESLSLRKGDEVIVKYEIIPYLTKDMNCKSAEGELIKAPTHCMYCGDELVNDPVLKCVNDQCPCRMIGTIVNYLNKLDIMNISESIVTTLFNMGVLRSIEDLYKLDKHRNTIISTSGFGDKSFAKIVKGIKARKKVKDYELLGALGIPGVAAKKFKKISFIYYIDELIEICLNGDVKSLTAIPGIEEKTANTIIVGIIKNEDLLDFLTRELTIISTKGADDNISILFSKVKDNKDFEKFLSDKGYDIASGYNKNISLLIVPSLNETSTKIEKAKKDGKEIITIDEAYKRFGYKP